MSYHFSTRLHTSFDQALVLVRQALEQQGFGVVSDIDLSTTLKNKLKVDFRPYRILGACKPQYAHQAVLAEPWIGTLLPCNIVVQAHAATDIEVSAIDPVASMQAVNNPQLASLALEVQAQLRQLIDQLHQATS